MAYNLRRRTIRQELIDETQEVPPEDEEAIERSESEGDSEYSDAIDESSESDVDMEDGTLNKRLLESGARGRPRSTLRGKNGFKWKTGAPERRSDRVSDVLPVYVPGPNGDAKNLDAIEKFWEILFNEEMINIIVQHTNNKIEEVCLELVVKNKAESYHHLTDSDEIRAYIGLLYYQGLWKSADVDNDNLWDKKNGITFYRCIFPRQRFTFLSPCLRFDDKNSRDENDRFSAIRQIWDIFMTNCQQYHTPSNKCTVDEQLLGFRGRCVFRMYMKDKPDKYGLKIVTLNDAETSYLIYGVPYLGKGSAAIQEEKIHEYFFRVVTTPIHGSHRTVTCDNWFMSVPLLQRMLPTPYNITITGTVRKNKREIPAEMKIPSKSPPDSKFCHTDNLTLVSFTPKKNKIVLLLSSHMHTTENEDGKPKITRFYNKTKGGTDTFDKLCHSFSVSRRTNRWPMRIFYGMLDQAAVNSRILFMCKLKADNSEEKCTAIKCLEELSFYLVRPYLQKKYNDTLTLRRDLKIGIANILGLDLHDKEDKFERVKFQKRSRCAVCSRKQDKKTNEGCASCNRPVCDDHRLIFCKDCCDM